MRISSDYAKPRVSFKGYIIDTHLQQVPKGSLLSNKEFPANALDSFVKNSFTVFVNQNYRTDSVKKALISNFEGIAWAEKQKNEVLNSGRSKIDLKPEEIQFSKNEIEANMAMINEYKDSDFYKIVAVCQPSKTNGKANNIRNIINQNKDTIFGLKFNPQELQLNANSKLYDDYLKLAEEKGLPCLFHSQVNIDYANGVETANLNWSDPQYIYELARRHPKVPVILGHTGAGGPIAHRKAIKILEESIKNNDALLYADISWMNFENGMASENPTELLDLIESMTKLGKEDRILFGSDGPFGCYGEKLVKKGNYTISPHEAYENTITNIKTAIKRKFPEDGHCLIRKIFYDNANKLFFKEEPYDPRAIPVRQRFNKMSKTKIGALTIGGISLAGAIGYYFKAKHDNIYS